MKILKKIALATALTLTSLAANATNFNFAYSFDNNSTGDGNPVAITGSFVGTQIGDLISNISNSQVFLNGTAFSGPLFVEAYNASTQAWDNTIAPVISTDASKNNFIFADTDVANNTAVSNYFWISSGQAVAVTVNYTDAYNNPLSGYETTNSAKWSVVAAPVPEPESWALMVAGLGFVGLVARRRRQA